MKKINFFCISLLAGSNIYAVFNEKNDIRKIFPQKINSPKEQKTTLPNIQPVEIDESEKKKVFEDSFNEYLENIKKNTDTKLAKSSINIIKSK
ncbi:MAG: hypothetical protein ABIF12_02490 [bacterium]